MSCVDQLGQQRTHPVQFSYQLCSYQCFQYGFHQYRTNFRHPHYSSELHYSSFLLLYFHLYTSRHGMPKHVSMPSLLSDCFVAECVVARTIDHGRCLSFLDDLGLILLCQDQHWWFFSFDEFTDAYTDFECFANLLVDLSLHMHLKALKPQGFTSSFWINW